MNPGDPITMNTAHSKHDGRFLSRRADGLCEVEIRYHYVVPNRSGGLPAIRFQRLTVAEADFIPDLRPSSRDFYKLVDERSPLLIGVPNAADHMKANAGTDGVK